MTGSRAKSFLWDEETTHKLIASYVARQKLPKRKINQNVWDGVFEDVFKGQKTDCTVSLCKWRFTRLRIRYKAVRSGDAEKSGEIAKFYDEMDAIYADEQKATGPKERPRKQLFKIMCRCCGQLSTDLTTLSLAMDSPDELNLMNWFLAFTGLRPDTVCQAYTKICGICRRKLTEARKFREQCLMAEQVLLQDLPEMLETPVKTEAEVGDKQTVKKKARPRRKKLDPTKQDVAECGQCKKIFTSKRLLASHMKGHNKVNKYKCPICDKTYFNKSGLFVHQATHDASLMKFQCATCGVKFPSAVYLRYHMNRHTDTRPFVCKACGKAYHRSHALNHHVRSAHLNVKYACDECTDVYARPTRLKLHVVLAHRGAILRCSVCDHESVNRSKFMKHLRGDHNIGFNQSVHVILANANEMLVRRRKLDETLIQTALIKKDGNNDGHNQDVEIC